MHETIPLYNRMIWWITTFCF